VTDDRIGAQATVAARVEQIFAEAGAYREGHFKLKSGRHSDRYLEKFQVLQWPERVTELCRLIAELVSQPGRQGQVDVVVGPTTGGVILAYETARQLGVRGIFAEQVTADILVQATRLFPTRTAKRISERLETSERAVRREFRRGFAITPGERVLLVDDVVTTGASLAEMVPLVESAGGELVATVVLVDRTGELRDVVSTETGRAYPAQALWSLSLPTYQPGRATCPGCKTSLPLQTPGSSGTTAGHA
jgi:orotate phosphoribosyltransferase